MQWNRLRRGALPGALPAIFAASYCLWIYRFRVPGPLLAYHRLLFAKGSGACRLTVLDPFDPSIRKYIHEPKQLNCRQLQGNLFRLEAGALVADEAVLNGLNLAIRDLKCEYRELDHDSGVGDDAPRYGPWRAYSSPVKVASDFVEVSCPQQFMTFNGYNRILAHIVPKWSENVRKKTKLGASIPYSVVVVGIDSMSNSNFIRALPKSLRFLKSLNASIFAGHTKVGDNTWVNSIAMLTGLFSEGGRADVKPDIDISNYARFFDNWANYIWKDYSAAGYTTFMAEDRPQIHNFNYPPKKGFLNKPVDHYMRPYWLAVEASGLKKRSSAFCYNDKPSHRLLQDYLSDFVHTYQNVSLARAKRRPIFAFFWWQELSHEYLNAIKAGDADLLAMFKSIEGNLGDTILIVVSDHGHRYDAIRQSVVGRIEARMPFLAIAPPPRFRKEHPELYATLHANKNRLTSQFDVFATFVDILNGFPVRGALSSLPPHAISLFRPVPPDRTCLSAHIPEEYCSCYTENPLDIRDPVATRVADVITSYVNALLSAYRHKCAVLTLARIIDANVFLPNRRMIKDPQVAGRNPTDGFFIKYRLQLEAAPSGALLEAVVKYDLDADEMSVEGNVDRNNKYGNTSACVADDALRKKYCFCI